MSHHFLIIEQEDKYTDYLKKYTEHDLTTSQKLHVQDFVNADSVLLDGEVCTPDELIQVLKENPNLQYKNIFFINTLNADMVKLDTKGIMVLNDIEPEKVSSQVDTFLLSKGNVFVFSFMGADRGSGNTSVIHATAEKLAGMTSKKVLVITAHDNFNETVFAEASFDNLSTSISANILSFDEIMHTATHTNGYYCIGCMRDMMEVNRYTVDNVKNFYSTLMNQDGYIVLLDLGANINNPFFLISLEYISQRILVTKCAPAYHQVFDMRMHNLFIPFYGLGYEDFKTVMNCYEKGRGVSKMKYDILCKIPFSEFAFDAEAEEIPLHKLDTNFDVEDVAEYIAKLNGFYVSPDVGKEDRFGLGRIKKIFTK